MYMMIQTICVALLGLVGATQVEIDIMYDVNKIKAYHEAVYGDDAWVE